LKPPVLRIGITTGDPAGIGPEISLRAVQDPSVRDACRIVLFGDYELLRSQADRLGIDFDFPRISDLTGPGPACGIFDLPAARSEILPGRGSKAAGAAAARNIIHCAEACRDGLLDGMVTAPLNKAWLQQAGYSYSGHTEFLADLAGVPEVAMAFLTERLKVVLATIHVPLKVAIELITIPLIINRISILIREFSRLGLRCGRIAVAGMNPHAGEDGLLGREEQEIIGPAVAEAGRLFPQTRIHGPLPADTLFYRAVHGEFDAVLALFHDQGLGPIKLVGFGEAVNVTLGLPFIRASVDHGTAFDIAGKGIARHQSMVSAISWALRLCQSKKDGS
jgi:4-phospho-D-threonate 3-dehydrogenase / 4-phospho-D-erythronate 3-dehydrogenase